MIKVDINELDKEEAKRLFAYTQKAFFRRPRPITGLEDTIRVPPIIANFKHLERICHEFDLPMEIFYDKEEDVERNWRNFCEFLLDERIPGSLKLLSAETYPVLRTISQLYEAIKDFDLPRSRYPFKSENLERKIYQYITRTRPYTNPPEGEQVEILRKSLFLTKEDLATRIGLTKSDITNIEKGNSKIRWWECDHKLGGGIFYVYFGVGSVGQLYFGEYMAYRLDKRLNEFLNNKKIPLFSRDRLPRSDNIYMNNKYAIVGLHFILKNYGKRNI